MPVQTPGSVKNRGPFRWFCNYLAAGLLLGCGCFLLFFDLAEDMMNRELVRFDQTIALPITSLRNPLLTRAAELITDMGSAPVLISLALIMMWFLWKVKKESWDAALLAVALTGAWFMNYMLKLAFHRSRPTPPGLVQASGYSFPSGHAMISFAFYGMLIYLLWINHKPGRNTYLAAAFLTLLIVFIGISRIYLGVHYPSDVIAGYAAGGIWLTGCILALNTVRRSRSA